MMYMTVMEWYWRVYVSWKERKIYNTMAYHVPGPLLSTFVALVYLN